MNRVDEQVDWFVGGSNFGGVTRVTWFVRAYGISLEPMATHRNNRSASWRAIAILSCMPFIAAAPVLYNFSTYFSSSGTTRTHEDEVYWVGSTYYYNLAFVQRDWKNPDWQLLPARENSPLGKYVMGAALQLNGRRIESLDLLGSFYLLFADTPGAWGSGDAYVKRDLVAQRVDPAIAATVRIEKTTPIQAEDLLVARQLMCILAMIAAMGIWFLCKDCGSPIGGLFAAFLFAWHPIVQLAYRTAMIDMVALCFSVLFVAAFMTLVGNASRTKVSQAITVAVTGVLLAMACGSKMNSLVVVGVAGVCAIFALLQSWRKRNDITRSKLERTRFLSMAAVFVVAFLFFVVTNPTLYVNTVDGLVALVREHRLTAEIQETFVGRQMRTASERWQVIQAQVGRTPMRLIAMQLSVAWQLVYCYRTRNPFIVVVLWWFVALTMLLAWMPFNWPRYSLPMVPPTVLLMGKTLSDLGRFAVLAVQRHQMKHVAVST